MAIQNPGVQLNVVDFSQFISKGTSRNVGVVTRALRGPLEPTLINNFSQYKDLYSSNEILETNLPEHWGVQEILSVKGAGVYVRRCAAADAKHGGMVVQTSGSGDDNIAISSGIITSSVDSYSFSDDEVLLIVGANPGAWNNSLKVTITDASNETFVVTIFEVKDGLDILVEQKKCSRIATKKDGYGDNIYVQNVFENSKYIKVVDNTSVSDSTLPKTNATAVAFQLGTNGTVAGEAEVIDAYDDFKDMQYNLACLCQCGIGAETTGKKISEVQQERSDCFGYLDIPRSEKVATDAVAYKNNTLAEDNAYVGVFSPFIQTLDAKTNTKVWVGPSAYAASLYMKAQINRRPWNAAFGRTFGVISALKLDQIYGEADKAILSAAGVNVFVAYPGGYMLFDNRTCQTVESALSFIEVANGVLAHGVFLKAYADGFIGQPLTENTRIRFVAGAEDYWARVYSEQGVFEPAIIKCDPLADDSGNNPANNIDQGIFTCSFLIKPARAIRNIVLNLVLLRTGATISVVEGTAL